VPPLRENKAHKQLQLRDRCPEKGVCSRAVVQPLPLPGWRLLGAKPRQDHASLRPVEAKLIQIAILVAAAMPAMRWNLW